MFKYLSISFLVLASAPLGLAQKWMPELIPTSGSIFKHSEKIDFSTDVFSPGLELKVCRQPGTGIAWESKHPGSYFAVSLTYRYFGEPRLGHAYGVYPSITTSLLRIRQKNIWFEIGSGLSYLSRPFKLGKEEYNNAIGSHVNNLTNFRLFITHLTSNGNELITGLSFAHYSNGALSMPNLGINVYSINLGLRFGYLDMPQGRTPASLLAENKWRAMIGGRFTQVEWITPEGPKYPVYSYHAGVKYIANVRAHWLMGLEYEMNRAVYWWGLDSFTFGDRTEAFRQSYRLMAFAGREIVFDRWSILLQLNINLRKNPIGTPKAYAEILGVKHYFAPNKKINPYIGVFMKAHGTVAEYFALGMGTDLL